MFTKFEFFKGKISSFRFSMQPNESFAPRCSNAHAGMIWFNNQHVNIQNQNLVAETGLYISRQMTHLTLIDNEIRRILRNAVATAQERSLVSSDKKRNKCMRRPCKCSGCPARIRYCERKKWKRKSVPIGRRGTRPCA